MTDTAADIAALERVLFRLASASDERFLEALDTLLPELLRLFTRDPLDAALRDQILQVLAHIKTRLQAHARPRLPIAALAQIVSRPPTIEGPPPSAFAANFAFLFIELGFAGASADDQSQVLAGLCRGLAQFTATQRETVFRLLLRALRTDSAVPPALDETSGAFLMDFLIDLVLVPSSTAIAAAPTAATTATTTTTNVFGLMGARIDRLRRVRVGELTRDDLYASQLQALKFAKAIAAASGGSSVANMAPLVYVAGAASHDHIIKSFCEEQLQRLIKEPVDPSPLESLECCRFLLRLVLGSKVGQTAGAYSSGTDTTLLSERARLADTSILQVASLVQKSKAACDVVPAILQVICQLMFGAAEPGRPANITQRIQIAGAQVLAWVFHNCELAVLEGLLAPVLFPSVLRVLMDPNADADMTNMTFWHTYRQGIYEAISVLCARSPGIVAGSVQAFQLLLGRCLIEESRRAGANALQAFNAIREAYEAKASSDVWAQVQKDLIGIIGGAKLYDTNLPLSRVRAAVAEWVKAALVNDSNDAELRFSLFRLCADEDEGVRNAARLALHVAPLPPVKAIVDRLNALAPSQNLKVVLSAQEVEQCVRFCESALCAMVSSSLPVNMDEVDKLIRFFIVTWLTPAINASPDPVPTSVTAPDQRLDEALADCIQSINATLPDQISSLLVDNVEGLISATVRSTDRQYQKNTSRLLLTSFGASVGLSEQLMTRSSPNDRKLTAHIECGEMVVRACVIRDQLDRLEVASGDTELVKSLLSHVVCALGAHLSVVSKFGSLPRGSQQQDDLLVRLRTAIDCVGITGNWNGLSGSADQLFTELVMHLGSIVRWNLGTVRSDGHLQQKLKGVQIAALEAISTLVANRRLTTPCLNPVLDACWHHIVDWDAEMQFAIAHCLVACGSAQLTNNEQNSASFPAVAILNRVLESTTSQNAPSRRSTTVWLLCICAAGLLSTEPVTSAWSVAFQDEGLASLLLQIHEHFTSMLNDDDSNTKECAVKGLAYLRLQAPTSELGNEFSDNLFRRLRCFRAFVSSSSAPSTARGESRRDDEDEDASNLSGGNDVVSGDIVGNAAYREVSNIAADIGDPELMYTLLYLSTSDVVLGMRNERGDLSNTLTGGGDEYSFSRVDAAFRLKMLTEAQQHWLSPDFVHRGKLLPWLYLLKNHSNPAISTVINRLWGLATSGSVPSIWRPLCLPFVLSRLEFSRNFKYREAACLGLIEWIVGAEAADIQGNFVRIWKLTARSVDDVQQVVAVAGLKLFKALGELSLRVAVADKDCRQTLLDFLILEAMVHKNLACRALGIDLLLRLIKQLEPAAIQNRIATLILTLLEYLSSLEIPELQYAQFHVEKKSELERLRVTLSQTGPVGQLLELCTTQLKTLATTDTNASTTILHELTRGITYLLQFGVGLNTRVGAANFVATLATELTFELKKSAGMDGILTRALIPYIGGRSASENDQYGDEAVRYGSDSMGISDPVVLQSYIRAAAYLCPHVEDLTVVRSYVRRGIFAHRNNKKIVQSDNSESIDDQCDGSRYLLVSALAAKEFVRKCPPNASSSNDGDVLLMCYVTDIFPAAFVGQFASSEILHRTWMEVLEELPPTIAYDVRSLESLILTIKRLVRHPAWDTRRQAIKALQALFVSSSVYRSRVSISQRNELREALIAALPGRLWRGKGAILEALVAVALVDSEDSDFVESLFPLLLTEADRGWANKDVEYVESALLSIVSLATQVSATAAYNERRLRTVLDLLLRLRSWHPTVPTMALAERDAPPAPQTTTALPPMLLKVVFETFAAVWPHDGELATSDANCEKASQFLQWLDDCLSRPELYVWSVRRAILAALASVVTSAPAKTLKSNRRTNVLVTRCCGSMGIGDGKYGMIRVAAGEVLLALTRRRTDMDIGLQLQVDRERLLGAVTVLRRSEEPAEQLISTQILTQLSEL